MTPGDDGIASTVTRVGIPLALVFAGVLTLAAGAARVLADAFVGMGLDPGAAVVAALVGAGVIPPLVVGGLLVSHSPGRRARRIAAAGLALMGVAVVTYAVRVPSGTRAVVVAGGYLLGLLVALTAVGRAAMRTRPVARGSSSRLPAFSWAADRNDAAYPTDGGEAEDDLKFPLDDE